MVDLGHGLEWCENCNIGITDDDDLEDDDLEDDDL